MTLLAILLLSSCDASTQSQSRPDIKLTILNNKLHIKNDSIALNIEITNNTDFSYLMFAFGLLHEEYVPETFYMEGLEMASGTAMFIHDQDSNTLDYEEPDIGPETFDDLQDLKKQTDEVYIQRMLVLKPETTIRLTLRAKLIYFEPGPGEYLVHLIHYSGSNVYVFVPAEKVKELEQQYDAHVFQGWIKSNTVKLMVE